MLPDVRKAFEEAGVVFDHRMGVGAFAEVWRVRYKGVPRALRVCLHPLDDTPAGTLVQKERDTLRQIIVIPPLLNRIGFIEETPLAIGAPGNLAHYYATVWQLAATDLGKWWLGEMAPDKGERLLRYLRQVAESIDLLNDYGFHHRDVKPENILVDGNTAWICDLGLAKEVGCTTYIGTFVGTEKYWPPEMEDHGESHATNDLYCLAASYLRLKTGLAPAAFLGMVAKGLTPPNLLAAEAPIIAAALHPDADLRPQDGAVAWVKRLERALTLDDTWPKDQNAVPTVTLPNPKGGKSLRLALLRRLEEICPTYLLDSVAFHLEMPRRDRPAATLPHGERCLAVLEWVEAHRDLADLQTALDELTRRP